MKNRIPGAAMLAAWLVAGGCTLHLDGPMVIKADGTHKHRPVYIVDGSIQVEADARASRLRTVDGDISLGENAQATSIGTVDGNVALASQAVCSGDVSSVDGRIELAPASRVKGDVRSMVGTIRAEDSVIEGSIRSVASRIELSGHTRVGGIVLDKPDPSVNIDDHAEQRPPVVLIGPGAIVSGPIVAQRGGTLLVSRQAHIGTVRGIAVQRFDGPMPAAAGNTP